MGNVQEQALGTEKFRHNQALFRKYTTIERVFKYKIVTEVEPVLISPLVDHLIGFGQVTALTMLQHMFSSYRAIDRIDLQENAVKMMGPYKPTEPLDRLIEKSEKRREFLQAGGQTISDALMMSRGITLLVETWF